ncbi:hypothetical protein HQ586_02435 [Candidatus Bathyarchaeota archaeon]|nr:hypothetical protein [Candidatus Bathyarchaeota archaeon]
MEEIEASDELSVGEKSYPMTEELPALLKALSNTDGHRIFLLAGEGIRNSTYAIKELNISPKRYYARMRELVDIGLVCKMGGVYRQTALGRVIYDRFLPAMGKAVDAREELELIACAHLETGVKRRILEELGIPIFEDSTTVKVLGDYEAFVFEAMDLYDSAEESVLLATTYFDVRVMEAFLRAVDRSATNRVIMGKNSRSSEIQNLRTMLSVTFTKELINFASDIVELRNLVRFADIPYKFCVVDGHHSIIETSNPIDESFIVALSLDDRDVGEKLIKLFEALWKTGESV